MSYTGLNINGGVTLCYPFYERMISCTRRESLPVKMCALEAEDYLECVNRKKQVKKYFFPFLVLIILPYDVHSLL